MVKFESARSPERYRSNWVRLLLSTWANQVGNVSAEGHLGMGQLLRNAPGHRTDGVVQNGDELSLSREDIVVPGGEGGGARDEIPEGGRVHHLQASLREGSQGLESPLGLLNSGGELELLQKKKRAKQTEQTKIKS